MKALQDTPTAELLAQWKMLRDRSLFLLVDCLIQNKHAIKEHNAIVPRISAIAAELDRRTEYISVGEDGFPYFGEFKFEGKNGTKEPKHDAQWVAPTIPTEDLRDLLTWLLMKGGNG